VPETAELPAVSDFDALYRAHYPAVLRAAYAITLDLEEGREITQETFLRLWEHRDRLAPGSNEKAWLMRVATNLGISYRRSLLVHFRARRQAGPEQDPVALALAGIEGQRVRRALAVLKPRERAVLALRFDHDLSFAEVGEVLGHPEATARTWCRRAVERLRHELLPSTAINPVTEEVTS
jgi:RNA polymerase sigma-70 factor, ECF subfamily